MGWRDGGLSTGSFPYLYSGWSNDESAVYMSLGSCLSNASTGSFSQGFIGETCPHSFSQSFGRRRLCPLQQTKRALPASCTALAQDKPSLWIPEREERRGKPFPSQMSIPQYQPSSLQAATLLTFFVILSTFWTVHSRLSYKAVQRLAMICKAPP